MIRNEIFIGFLIGLIANCIGLYFATLVFGNDEGFVVILKSAAAEGFLGKLISLGAVLNLLTFFIFIKKNQDYRARGVLLATIVVAVTTFVINL